MLTIFKTTDIVLAACLKLQGYALTEIRCTGKQGTFVFADVDSNTIREFNCAHLLVEPVQFHSMVRQLSASVLRAISTGPE